MKWLGVCALIVVVLAASVSSAQARQARTAKQVFYHTDGYIKAIGKNAHRTIYDSNPRIRHRWRTDLRYLMRLRHRAYISLHPPVIAKPQGASHYAMWQCIHRKEGAWDSNTGNGYLGGLQMTPGWGGVSRPDLLSPEAQMELAERGYAASGYSLSWLRGQWPNTSYGCI